MKTLHSSAIFGLTLLAGAPVAQADVITDWNQTAIEVMKAANVAGNPWTRSMAMIINVGATVGVLESVCGTGPHNFTATDIADPRLQRQFASVAQMGKEQCEVRIWGGIHFRNSLEVGEGMGHKIADHLVGNYLKPTQKTADATR